MNYTSQHFSKKPINCFCLVKDDITPGPCLLIKDLRKQKIYILWFLLRASKIRKQKVYILSNITVINYRWLLSLIYTK